MKSLYSLVEPYAAHQIPVGEGHTLYAEECGNPQGLPVLFLHGGPGSGCRPIHRGFFDPARYRAVFLDQRGAGRSTPHGGLQANTTAHLLQDLETLRRHLHIERWLLFGGSWGAALALLYAQQNPGAVLGMVLRGSFLARAADLDWFLAGGAGRIYPEAWQELMDFIPPEERGQPIRYLYRQVCSDDQIAQRRAAAAWQRWSGRVTLGDAYDASRYRHLEPAQFHAAQIGLHYAEHLYFLNGKTILEGCPAIAHIPAYILHGRRDLVCPAESAYSLHQALPGSELEILTDTGHIAEDGHMLSAVLEISDRLAQRFAP
jgi:proline iminopeptidase